MWILYELLFAIGLLLYLPRAVWRRRLPHPGWTMRLGRYPEPVARALGGRRTIWVHAVSVGEVLAVRPLLTALRQAAPAEPLVLSTITPSGFSMAERHVGAGGVAVYFPLDLSLCASRALEALRPRLLLLMESELWPTVIRLAAARGVPVAVVNGRVSPRSFARYRLARPWVRSMLSRVAIFLMQSQADADRLLQLGAPQDRVRVVGSLKWDASLLARPDPEAVRQLAGRLGLGGRDMTLVAGSTHRGEEAAVLGAFQALRASRADARAVIAPRHLERLDEVERLARQAGFAVARLSQADGAGRWQVGLVDTWGQLPLYYGLASIVFIGGSLIPHGGQNPLEAASLGKPVVFGPSMHNFEAIAHQLLAHRAARQVASGEELSRALAELSLHDADAQAMGRRAEELTQEFQGATQRTLQALAPLFGDSH
ncbi:MAG: 3-deoxy-D-manno-octulosonic acid transferase [Candidatus Omnitrophica bacterium]|nr:3-deoxy-D-manno-octulosonic acid transferase [Candidatus Omnitrophota bacterium]